MMSSMRARVHVISLLEITSWPLISTRFARSALCPRRSAVLSNSTHARSPRTPVCSSNLSSLRKCSAIFSSSSFSACSQSLNKRRHWVRKAGVSPSDSILSESSFSLSSNRPMTGRRSSICLSALTLSSARPSGPMGLRMYLPVTMTLFSFKPPCL